MIRVPVLLGPTAVGKTDLALKIARQFGMEIISCDSRQIYRFMDVGTAKPSSEMLKSVKHWMIDIANPDERYSCFQYALESARILREQAARSARALVCGGSGLYFGSLCNGIGPMVEAQPELRLRLLERAQSVGNQGIFDELMRVDPVTAAGSHPSNIQRNIRALEIYAVTGLTQSALKKRAAAPCDMEFLVMALSLPRSVLYERIDGRVDAMTRAGLVEEFYALRSKGYGESAPGMRCVGYKELFAVENRTATLPEALDKIKQNSRNFAKRQITWLRHQVHCVEIDMRDDPFEQARKKIDEFLSK
jgi:tRNA dimethylallyltransferase